MAEARAGVPNAPTANLNDFISKVKSQGLARNNRFGVLIGVPQLLTRQGVNPGSIVPEMFMFCESATLPGMNLSSTQARTFGEYREMPYERLYDAVTLSFINDSGLNIKSFWEQWINSIQNPYTRNFEYYNDYTGQIDIFVYDAINAARYVVTLYEAYPKTLSQSELNQSGREIIKTSVTIQYRYWRSSAIAAPSAEDLSRGGVYGANASLAAELTRTGERDFFDENFQGFQGQFGSTVRNLFNNPIVSLGAADILKGKGRILNRLRNLF